MRWVIVLCTLTAASASGWASADVPRTISYQGVLKEVGGDIVSDGDYELTFRLYDTPDDLYVLWAETDTVSVSDGVFNVILGKRTSLDLEFDETYWLGVSVGGDPELTPRVELTASPYAFRAAVADSAVGGVSDGDWAVFGDDMLAAVSGNVGIGGIIPTHAKLRIDGGHLRVECSYSGETRPPVYATNFSGTASAAYRVGKHGVWGGVGSDEVEDKYGVSGVAVGNGYKVGVYGEATGDGTNWAGYFNGDVFVHGFNMPDGAANGWVLTSDSDGNGMWQAPPSGVGGSGTTNYIPKFIGSTTLGNSVMRENNGRIGIGTGTPQGKLHIREEGDTGVVIEIENTSGGSSSYEGITLVGESGTLAYIAAYDDGYIDPNVLRIANLRPGGPIVFLTEYFERLRVTDAGDVGIGTDSPAERLDVDGTVKMVGFQLTASPTDGYVLTSDASGIGTWQPAPGLTLPYDGSASSSSTAFKVTNTGAGPVVEAVNSASGGVGRVLNVERTQSALSGNDMLQIKVPSGSDTAFQFIECERGTDVEFKVEGDGDVFADGSYTGPADFSEMIEVSEGASRVEAGDVLVIDPGKPRAVVKATEPRSTLVAGIYSTRPGFIGSERDWDRPTGRDDEGMGTYTLEDMAAEFDEVPLAVVGIVPCKVSAENGPIRPGDLLVTSSMPGHAMRDEDPKVGTVVGKALQGLNSGTGMVKVLVTLH